jgi:hypothetical protein
MKTFKDFILNETSEEEYIAQAGKTARPWKTTRTYQMALLHVIKQGDRVLDYGSGPYQAVKTFVLAKGAEYFPYDKFGNIGDESLLKNNDVVMGSNVLNIQSKYPNSEQKYYEALNEMTRALKPTGTLVVNMPKDGPRDEWMSAERLEQDLKVRFNDVQHYEYKDVFVARSRKG